MHTINDVHQQFAEYFGSDNLKPYAYLLSKKMAEGHICLPLNKLTEEDRNLLPEAYQNKISSTTELKQEPLVQFEKEEKEPFIIFNENLYIQRYFAYETALLYRIQQFIETENAAGKQRIELIKKQEPFIKQLFYSKVQTNKNLPETNWQITAAITAILNNFTIITGGPGTGKTTTVTKILSILFNENISLKVALAAPTGKAATRLSESLKNASAGLPEQLANKFFELEPTTIHRLLKPSFGSLHFKHNQANPINADVIIVDESSMIDVALFARLMDAIAPHTRLILLGDKDQLASVEAGSLFGDLCQAQSRINTFSTARAALINSIIINEQETITAGNIINPTSHPLFEHVIELQRSHRFNDDKGIGKFSKAIIKNNIEVIDHFIENNNDEQVTIDVNYNEELINQFVTGYASYINETETVLAFKKLNNLRVLCAVREGPQGLYALNKKIEEHLIKLKLIRRSGDFYEHRPIMITSNNYELGLFNGDIGIIRQNEKGVAMAWFEDNEGKLKTVLPGYISQAETVFAMTIHKSQGSEFEKVLMVLPDKEDNNMLTRELLYTGITRAKQTVIIQARKEVILKAANAQVQRTSGIAARFETII